MVNATVLPDSRVKNPKGTVIANWEFEEVARVGFFFFLVKRKYRLEMEEIYCPNCGTSKGWVPCGIFSWVCFLCDSCAEKYGSHAALLPHSDQAFWDKVREEMLIRYGRCLTEQELIALAHKGELSYGLRLLERESPYCKG